MSLSMILSDTGNPSLYYGALIGEGPPPGDDDNELVGEDDGIPSSTNATTTTPLGTSGSVAAGVGSGGSMTTTTTTTKASKTTTTTKARKLQDLSTLTTWDKEPIIDGLDMIMSVPAGIMSMPLPMQEASSAGIEEEPTSPPIVSNVISFETESVETETEETDTEMSMSMSHSISMSISMTVSETKIDTDADVEKYTNPNNNIVTVAVPLDGPYHLLHKEEDTEYPTPAPVEAVETTDEPTPAPVQKTLETTDEPTSAPVTDEPTLKPTTGGKEEEEIVPIEPSSDVEEEYEGEWITASGALDAKASKQAKTRKKLRNRRFLQDEFSLSMSMSTSIPLVPFTFSMSMSNPDDPAAYVKDPLVEENLSVDSIHCTWRAWFAKKPKRACGILNDGNHTVPYTCDGEYPNVCCTESTITDPTLNLFGTCYKVRILQIVF
jgi:hypothetical protein